MQTPPSAIPCGAAAGSESVAGARDFDGLAGGQPGILVGEQNHHSVRSGCTCMMAGAVMTCREGTGKSKPRQSKMPSGNQYSQRPARRQRRSVRLRGYDYAQAGAYFTTLCTHGRDRLFGLIVNDVMVLNEYGRIAEEEWLRTPRVRSEVELDEFVVMPNHIHALVLFSPTSHAHLQRRAHGRAPLQRQPRSLGALMAGFKSRVTKRINTFRRTPGLRVWQRSYYERIVRNQVELGRIREYIVNNPVRWGEDENNPANIRAARWNP